MGLWGVGVRLVGSGGSSYRYHYHYYHYYYYSYAKSTHPQPFIPTHPLPVKTNSTHDLYIAVYIATYVCKYPPPKT